MSISHWSRWSIPGLIFGYIVLLPPLWAGEVIEATSHYEQGHFTVHTVIRIQASVTQTRKILTQFENLPKVNNGISRVEMLPAADNGRQRMRVESEICVLFICREFDWIQQAETSPKEIFTRIEPGGSDFREGWVRYQLQAVDGQTRLTMDADVVPNFWFPPIIGPLVIKKKLREEALETALGVERLANPQAP